MPWRGSNTHNLDVVPDRHDRTARIPDHMLASMLVARLIAR